MHYTEILDEKEKIVLKKATKLNETKKGKATKAKNNQISGEESYKFYAKLHPEIEKSMDSLGDIYSRIFEKIPKPVQLELFNAEIMGKAFAETHKVLLDTFITNATEWDKKQQDYLSNLDLLLQKTLDRLNGVDALPVITPNNNDRRFKAPEWQDFPMFDYLKQSYLLHSKYVNDLLGSLEGINEKTKEKAQFYIRSLLDAVSPTNFPFTNPEVLRETVRTQGQNLLRGAQKLLEDNLKSNFLSLPMFTNLKDFTVGKNLAITQGKVVYETPLFQLLLYKPTVSKVYKRPLLIIPPWINKYYIFDLQQDNSFVRWMLDQGFSVFTVSWVNPDKKYSNKGISDYVFDGVLDAVREVLKISGEDKLNIVSYCAGGVITAILASYLAKRIEKNPLASITFLATPFDFDKMGDLKVFICDEQLNYLEKRMQEIGYLPGNEMVRVFSALRANDLIWANYVNTYLLNKETFPMDFLYWNCDTTNVPAKLQIEYLRNVFHENRLMKPNGIKLNGQGINLKEIQTPIFAFATKSDHIVPWQSSYAIKKMCPKNTTFVLGASGHVAGIINPEHRNKYCYWVSDSSAKNSDTWLKKAKETKGSWWRYWSEWVKEYSGEKITTHIWRQTNHIEDAPGSYATSSSPTT